MTQMADGKAAPEQQQNPQNTNCNDAFETLANQLRELHILCFALIAINDQAAPGSMAATMAENLTQILLERAEAAIAALGQMTAPCRDGDL
tara:strand:- start:40 stop:312 length:273 start_codon:yes stop_codon:yes gene_type:complete